MTPYPPPSDMRRPDGSARFAFVTFLVMNDSFLPGALTVAYGLRRQSSRADAICLVTPEIGASARDALEIVFDRVLEVPDIVLPHKRAQRRQHVSHVFTRLHGLRLGPGGSLGGEYEKIVLLDADLLPLRDFDHLFTLRTPAGIPNEGRSHLVDPEDRPQTPEAAGPDATWVWHRVYDPVCPHGSPVPAAITDRVIKDPRNLGIHGSVLVVEPRESEYEDILTDLETAGTRRRVTDTWDWPDQQYLTARWSGRWTCVDARFSGLGGYPSLQALCGTHYAGIKPWQFRRAGALRRFSRYDDFRHWYATFTAMVTTGFPRLRNNPRIRTILARTAEYAGEATV